ncbi:putative gliding motility-associated lipoprotein GldB [Capnocytophaga sp. oral taxon 326 str. F0382]|nr:putative gliding motility-associated lipoprotein GldB [Capnocytophaga sp. oral taxon 326 str. F0382]
MMINNTKKMTKKLLLFASLLLMVACGDKKEKEIAAIPMSFEMVRLDSLFVKTPDAQFPALRHQYPYFFTPSISDSEWVEIKNKPIFPDLPEFANIYYHTLYSEVEKQLGDLSTEKKELKSLFQHIKYYFPKFQAPKVITLLSRVDYESRVIYADSRLLIGSDNYLGAKHPFYQDMQHYISTELDKKYLAVDVADAFAEKLVPRSVHLSFLDNMIYEGKKLYLEQQLLPKKSTADLLRYTDQQYAWAEANEPEIWRYFIEKELLYQTDKKLLARFLYPAPFSKFYLELDNESPGQIAKFMGLRIVQAYAENHKEEPLVKILAMNSDALFKQSQYKPNK